MNKDKSLFVYVLLVAMLDIQICSQCQSVIKLVKVRCFHNEFMAASFLPKYKQKNVSISALTGQKS